MKRILDPEVGAREGLSAAEVVAVAASIADREGLVAVSMRRLARELSVTPMALYWHFSDKGALLDAMAEAVIAEADFVDSPRDAWQDRYRGVLTTLVRLLHVHPWTGRLIIERLVPMPNFLAALEILLDSARQAGLDPEQAAVLVQQSVQSVVALVEREPHQDEGGETGADSCAALRASLEDRGSEGYPNIRAAAVPLTTPPDLADYYRLGIDTLIGGIHAIARGGGDDAVEAPPEPVPGEHPMNSN